MSDQPGFKVDGLFYPWVIFDEWLLPDCRLVRQITGYNETEIITGKASNRLVNLAFAAVAFKHGNPGVTVDQVAAHFDQIKLDQSELVGFDLKGDARPPDETAPASEPSETSTPSSDALQETSDQTSSGVPLSATG